MKILTILTIAVLSATALFSCKKETDDTAPKQAHLTITQPVPNQKYYTGDTVFITGLVKHVVNLHGYHIALLNSAGDSIFHARSHMHAAEIEIREQWIDTFSGSQDLRLFISVPVDHDGAEVTKEIPISVAPQP